VEDIKDFYPTVMLLPANGVAQLMMLRAANVL
jgi:hypothetical protein